MGPTKTGENSPNLDQIDAMQRNNVHYNVGKKIVTEP